MGPISAGAAVLFAAPRMTIREVEQTMNMRIVLLSSLAALVTLTTPAPGQTTQPSVQAWPRAVEAFAKSLAEGNLNASVSALMPGAVVRRFDGAQNDELWRLAGRVEKSTIVGQHAYIHPPLVMAADIAVDFKNAAAVPDKAKVKFIVDDDGEIKRANATAVEWVVEQLKVREGTPVGVIVLWAPRPVPPGMKSTEPQAFDAIFVLCRGEQLAGGKFKINEVIYGEPAPEVNR
jgi:hypothetical protein